MLFGLILISHEMLGICTVKPTYGLDAEVRFMSYSSVLTNKEGAFVLFGLDASATECLGL